MQTTKTPLLALLLPVLALPLAAQESSPAPEARGLAIAVEADNRDDGFHDSIARLEMVLRNRHGQESRRSLRNQSLEQENDGDKGLVIFDAPADIDGTALLTFSHKTGDDDQWLYLPALARVKRISSSNKSGPFVGSEFAYEDITAQEVKKYRHKWLRDEPCGKLDCFVLERRPLYEKSGYTRLATWYDKAEYRMQRVDYYDRKDFRLKSLALNNYRRYLDRFWKAHELEMTNHQTGKRTVLVFGEHAFGTGLGKRDFRKRALDRQ